MTGVRERARAQTTAEIIRLAHQQIAVHGAASLSLRAIAREMGIASSAVYRYFASRDELLTELIVRSYHRLGEAVEGADAAVGDRGDLKGRWRVAAHAVRDWCVANPAEHALLFGTPVPGYAAPADTVGPATRYTLVLSTILADLNRSGVHHRLRIPAPLRADLARLRVPLGIAAGDLPTLALGLAAWSAVMGAINLELFGHLHHVVDTPGALFHVVVEQHAELLFSGTAARRPPSKG